MWKAVARTITRMQMILHLNRGRPWHVVKKSQLAKVALAVVFKHLHKSPWTVLSTFSLWMFVDHIWYSFLVSIKESRKKQIFQGQADRKRLPPLRSAFCDFLCVFFIIFYDLLWWYVYWNRFYTIKSHFHPTSRIPEGGVFQYKLARVSPSCWSVKEVYQLFWKAKWKGGQSQRDVWLTSLTSRH